MLIVDEAHATGVFGETGLGLVGYLEGRDNVITLRTLGKALGCEGALLCGPVIMRDFLVNRGRSFIFSTAPSPLMAAVARAALRVVAEQPERREALWQRVQFVETLLTPLGIVASGSQIIPITIGDDARTMAAARVVQAAGYDVRGIRPPTVPVGTSRLRVSITLNVTPDDIAGLTRAISEALA
jgi:8-amino-7-oxononanoate synthase